MAYVDGEARSVPPTQFPTTDILPAEFKQELVKGTLVLNPVYAGDEHLGYIMLDVEAMDLSQTDKSARSIGNALRTVNLIEKLEHQAGRLQNANNELSTLANCDALTGLPNRLYFDSRLRALCDPEATSQSFALCFIDLDGFKAVNDNLGHEVGDLLLQSVALRLKSVVLKIVGDDGIVARFGGDEFTVIVCAMDIEKALERLAPAILETLSAPLSLSGHSVNISASIGSAIFPDHGSDTRSLLKSADTAMYQAKYMGKNRFVCATVEGGYDRVAFG